jgi:hypothetical protein
MTVNPVPSVADVETQAVVYARNRMGHRNYGDPDYDRYAAYIDGYLAGATTQQGKNQ